MLKFLFMNMHDFLLGSPYSMLVAVFSYLSDFKIIYSVQYVCILFDSILLGTEIRMEYLLLASSQPFCQLNYNCVENFAKLKGFCVKS